MQGFSDQSDAGGGRCFLTLVSRRPIVAQITLSMQQNDFSNDSQLSKLWNFGPGSRMDSISARTM
ncbi:hypothetical protein RB12221 [Rhodopirellula baltica SH 1]|uniref:Uncharacterized protein n=1 Tax=Rhodopirellula baltica (strain DSM 10527 / NCIMB 13988 / SH1) TaxID=243090 RepID=Q7UJ00_RHOBA|nr:hypothetical protein RB12221 [Rhodopirellula baltica SH 1]